MNIQFQGDGTQGFPISPLFFSLERKEKHLKIITDIPEKSMFMWYLYDPFDSLRGQCFCMGKGKTVDISQDENYYCTVAGPLPEGKWTIWTIFLPSAESRQESSSWTIKVIIDGSDAEGSPEADKNPEFVWLDSSGNVKEQYFAKDYCSEKRWFKGDFHVHTTYSDGKMPPSRIHSEAKKQELDFYAITDHNVNHTCWVDDGMPVIPGMELTLDEGHFNLFLSRLLPLYKEEFWHNVNFDGALTNTLLKSIRESGAVISINHPFMKPWQVKDKNLDLSLIDTMEIICDPTWNTAAEAAEMALKAFSTLWNHGIRVTGIGGSDIHNPPEEVYENSNMEGRIGLPSTWVLADNLSTAALLCALKEHKAYVTTGFQIDLKARYGTVEYDTGSCLPIDSPDDISFSVALYGNAIPYYIDIVENGNTSRLGLCQDGQVLNFTRNWDGEYHWLRIDIRNPEGQLCGFSNPLYSGSRTKEKMLWGNLIELIV